MSAHHALIAGYATPQIACDAADFDGTNDYMGRGADLTNIADSKSGIFSVWIRFDGNPNEQRILGQTTDPQGIEINRATSSGRFEIIGHNAAGSNILVLPTSSSFAAAATWRHFLASWDLAAGVGHLYVNDVSDVGTTTLTNDTLDYAGDTDWGVGANPTGGALKVHGCLAELYFAPGQYLDFSNAYYRRKFISAAGKPVWLGSDGSVPTGTAPVVYLHLDDGEAVANFATNRGTGGNFSITGTLDTASDSPSG